MAFSRLRAPGQQNRYQHRRSKRVTYRDRDVFTLPGFIYCEMECQQVVDQLFQGAFLSRPHFTSVEIAGDILNISTQRC